MKIEVSFEALVVIGLHGYAITKLHEEQTSETRLVDKSGAEIRFINTDLSELGVAGWLDEQQGWATKKPEAGVYKVCGTALCEEEEISTYTKVRYEATDA
jgi:hypothetical protein